MRYVTIRDFACSATGAEKRGRTGHVQSDGRHTGHLLYRGFDHVQNERTEVHTWSVTTTTPTTDVHTLVYMLHTY